MKTPDQPAEEWAPPDSGLPPSLDSPPLPPSPPAPARSTWIVPAPPGSTFHRLARTPLHRWWRPLLGTVFAVVMGLLVLLCVTVGAMATAALLGEQPLANTGKQQIFTDPGAELALQLTSLAVLTPVVLLAAWAVQRRPPGSLSSVTGRLRGRWLMTCIKLAIGASLLSYIASWITFTVTGHREPPPPGWAGWAAFLPPAAAIVLLVPFQAAAEEYVFRGWLLQAIASCTLETRRGLIGRAAGAVFRTPWPAILISAAVFTAGHAYKGWALLDVSLFGITAGWLAVRTGGLEAPIALHALNNLVAFLSPAALGRLGEAVRTTDVPWQSIIATSVKLTVFAFLILRATRERRPATVTPGGPPEPPPTTIWTARSRLDVLRQK
ncbi:MAG: lysostaphin resistance A-like protein [Actinomadura sp.]